MRRCVVLSSRAVFGALPGRRHRSATTIRSAPTRTTAPPRRRSKPSCEASGRAKAGRSPRCARPASTAWSCRRERASGSISCSARCAGEPVGAARRHRGAWPRRGGRGVAAASGRSRPAIAGRMFNCSDIVVSTRDIVGLVHRLRGVTGPLPEAAPAPANVMDCAGLRRLGVSFGGRPLFEETIAALVAAARLAPSVRDDRPRPSAGEVEEPLPAARRRRRSRAGAPSPDPARCAGRALR